MCVQHLYWYTIVIVVFNHLSCDQSDVSVAEEPLESGVQLMKPNPVRGGAG